MRGLPLVLQGSKITELNAIKTWNPLFVFQKLRDKNLTEIFSSKNRVFGPHWDSSR